MKVGIKKGMILLAGLFAAQAAFGDALEKARAKRTASTRLYNRSDKTTIVVRGALNTSWTMPPVGPQNKFITFQTGLQDKLTIERLKKGPDGKFQIEERLVFNLGPIKDKFAEIKKAEFFEDNTMRLYGRLRYQLESFVPPRPEIPEQDYLSKLNEYCGFKGVQAAVERASSQLSSAIVAYIEYSDQLESAETLEKRQELAVKAKQLGIKVKEARQALVNAEANAKGILPAGLGDRIKCMPIKIEGAYINTLYVVDNIKPEIGRMQSSKPAADTAIRIMHPTKFTNTTTQLIQVKGALGRFTTIQPEQTESFQTGLQDNLQIKMRIYGQEKILEFALKQMKDQFTWIKKVYLETTWDQKIPGQITQRFSLMINGVPRKDVSAHESGKRKAILERMYPASMIKEELDGTITIRDFRPKK